DRNERDRIASAVERVSGRTNSSRDNSGYAAAKLQPRRCALTERADHRRQRDRRKEHYEKEAAHRGNCCRSTKQLSPRMRLTKQHCERHCQGGKERKEDYR